LRRTLIERGYAQAQKFSWEACAACVMAALESAV